VRVIELLGPPGSGKSTLAARLGVLDGSKVVKDHSPGDLPALLRGIASAGTVLARRPPAGVSRTRWVAWAGRVAAVEDVVGVREARGAQLVVLDQGPAYTLWRMADGCRSRRAAGWWHGQLAAYAQLLDTLVLLDADPLVLYDRLRVRGKDHPGARRLDECSFREDVAEATHGYRVMAAWLELAGVPVVRLDTSRVTLEGGFRAVHDIVRPQPSGTE